MDTETLEIITELRWTAFRMDQAARLMVKSERHEIQKKGLDMADAKEAVLKWISGIMDEYAE